MCGQPGLWVPIHWHRNRSHSRCAHAMCSCLCVQNTGHSSCACSLDASSEAASKITCAQDVWATGARATCIPTWSHCCSVNAHTLDLHLWPVHNGLYLHTCSNAAVRSEPQALELPAILNSGVITAPCMLVCEACAHTYTHTHACTNPCCSIANWTVRLRNWQRNWIDIFPQKGSTNGQEVILKMCSSLIIQFSSVAQ